MVINHFKKIRRHVLGKPHDYLRQKISWYDAWHNFQYHQHFHWGILFLTIIGAIFFSQSLVIKNVYAPSRYNRYAENYPKQTEISNEHLFDINLSIPEPSKIVKAGSKTSANIWLYNFGHPTIQPSVVDLHYSIIDSKNTVVFFESETRKVIGEKDFLTKEFTIPKKLQPGLYILNLSMDYNQGASFASSSESFEVIKKAFYCDWQFWLLLVLIAFIFFCLFLKSKKLKSLQ